MIIQSQTVNALLTSLVLLLTVTSYGAGEVFTSSLKIQDVALIEGELLDSLQQYLVAQYDILKALSEFLYDRSGKFHPTSPDVHQKVAMHPNGAYLLMKLYSTAWLKHTHNVPSLNVHFGDDLRKRLPTHEDYAGAKSALVRLHYVYRLNVSDMYAGNYAGYQGPPLTPQDAFEIGRQAFIDGFAEQARQWLELAREKLREANRGLEDDGHSRDPTLDWTVPLLGRAYHFLNDSKRAQEMSEESMQLDPNAGDAIQLRQELSGEAQTTYGHSTKEWHSNMSDLCSREKDHRVPEIRPYHVCRFKPSPIVPYVNYKEEILSVVPYASVFYEVVSDAEINGIKEHIKDKMYRGTVGLGTNASTSGIRTSDLGWMHEYDLPLAAVLAHRVKDVTRLEVDERGKKGPSSSEAFQVVNYGLGGHYDAHMDPFGKPLTDEALKNSGERIATFLIYLSDVEKGGHTVFLRSGISVAPLKGMALLWYNYEPHMNDMQQLTFHAGCPVLYGQKWITNKWIWTYGNTFNRPCGTHPDATQLDVEQLVQSRDSKSRADSTPCGAAYVKSGTKNSYPCGV